MKYITLAFKLIRNAKTYTKMKATLKDKLKKLLLKPTNENEVKELNNRVKKHIFIYFNRINSFTINNFNPLKDLQIHYIETIKLNEDKYKINITLINKKLMLDYLNDLTVYLECVFTNKNVDINLIEFNPFDI